MRRRTAMAKYVNGDMLTPGTNLVKDIEPIVVNLVSVSNEEEMSNTVTTDIWTASSIRPTELEDSAKILTDMIEKMKDMST